MQDLFLYYRSMADRKRLAIVQYLAQNGEMSVTDLSKRLRLSQPLVSWHLSLLRKAGIVQTRKAGRIVFCSLDRNAMQGYQRRLEALLNGESPPRHEAADTSRLVTNGAGPK
ncbi:MAG: ArsR/SmtB family transcription factor [Chloroflexota bacterium]